MLIIIILFLFFSFSNVGYSFHTTSKLRSHSIISIKSFILLSTEQYEPNQDFDFDKSQNIEELLSKLKNSNVIDSNHSTSENIPQNIADQVKSNMPTEWEMKMNLLGITPFTIAGFVLAGIILSLNAILGTGWAGELFQNFFPLNGVSEPNISQTEVTEVNNINSIRTIKLNNFENLLNYWYE